MMRYASLYLNFIRFSFSRAMEFRADFFFRVFMDGIFYVVNILFYKIIYLHTPTLAGWNESQAMIFVSGYLLVDAIYMTLFSNNLWFLPTFINKGDLDYYLVRPVSTLFFVSLQNFAANSFLNLIMSVGIVVWAFAGYAGPAGPMGLPLFIALILFGSFINYMLHILLVITVFWTHSPRGFEQIVWSLSRVAERPDRIFKGWARKVFTVFFPFCLMASFPARLVLDEFNWTVLAHMAAVAAGFILILGAVWSRGLRIYSSASS